MPKLKETEDLAALIEEARKLGPMTDEQRREQAASFAFGQIALTSQWRDRSAPELAKLRETCRQMAGLGASTEDRTTGLDLGKYRVERADGSTRPGCKHADCRYFVLDLTHDRFAGPALAAYSMACQKEYPRLAEELDEIARAIFLRDQECARMMVSSTYGKTGKPSCPECNGTGLRECYEESRGRGGAGGVTSCECGAGHRGAL